MPQLSLFLLGPPRLELDGEPLDIGRRKAVALFAYLAVTGEEFEGPNVHLSLTHASGTELRASLVNKGTARAAQVGSELDVVFEDRIAIG